MANLKGSHAVPWLRFWILIGVLILAYFFIASALPYLILDENALEKFDGRRAWIVAHVFTASIPLMVGPFQIWMGVKGKWPAIHRKLGMAYIVSIAISACTAFYLALNIDGPWGEGAGLFGAGVLWLITTSMAYIAVRRHEYSKHMEWMIRSYVVTLAFVFFRFMIIVGKSIKIGSFDDRLAFAAWTSWLVPLLVAEVIISRRKSQDKEEFAESTL